MFNDADSNYDEDLAEARRLRRDSEQEFEEALNGLKDVSEEVRKLSSVPPPFLIPENLLG